MYSEYSGQNQLKVPGLELVDQIKGCSCLVVIKKKHSFNVRGWRHDIQHNDTQHNDTQHNDNQDKDIQHNDIQNESH